jgi:hypothetical protein
MGLDVSHLQFTLTPNDDRNFFHIDDWEFDCNVPLEYYSKYITTIDDLNFDLTLAVVKTEDDFEKLKKNDELNSTDYIEVFVGEMNTTMKEQISKFIVNQKLDSLESIQMLCEHDGLKYHTISFGKPIKVQGIYYIDNIGYQRKGMNNLFYEKFRKHMLWGKKEDFELAYSCVEGNYYVKNSGNDDLDEMRKNFRENFIEKFEFGKSLLYVSF